MCKLGSNAWTDSKYTGKVQQGVWGRFRSIHSVQSDTVYALYARNGSQQEFLHFYKANEKVQTLLTVLIQTLD